MGFWSALGNIARGKPVFGPESGQAPSSSGQQAPSSSGEQVPGTQPVQPGEQKQGNKIVPIVRMHRVECHNNGPRMDVYVDIKNESPVQVLLDLVRVVGSVRQLDTVLQPGQLKQFLVYSGPRLREAQPSGYTEVQYRNMENDYFVAQHHMRTKPEPDGTFSLYEFELISPIKDIH